MKLMKMIFVLALALVMQGCTHGPSPGSGFMVTNHIQTGSVELKVVANGTQLKIDNKPNGACNFARKDDWKKGCYFVNKGDTSTVTFDFKVRSDAENYYFKTFRICPWSYTEQKNEVKPNVPCALDSGSRMDFWVEEAGVLAIPNESGVITLPQPLNELDSFTLHNNNVVELDYFYWVEVCPRGDASPDSCLWTDPGMGNGGRR